MDDSVKNISRLFFLTQVTLDASVHLGDIKYQAVSALRGGRRDLASDLRFYADLLGFVIFQIFHMMPVVKTSPLKTCLIIEISAGDILKMSPAGLI